MAGIRANSSYSCNSSNLQILQRYRWNLIKLRSVQSSLETIHLLTFLQRIIEKSNWMKLSNCANSWKTRSDSFERKRSRLKNQHSSSQFLISRFEICKDSWNRTRAWSASTQIRWSSTWLNLKTKTEKNVVCGSMSRASSLEEFRRSDKELKWSICGKKENLYWSYRQGSEKFLEKRKKSRNSKKEPNK